MPKLKLTDAEALDKIAAILRYPPLDFGELMKELDVAVTATGRATEEQE